MYILTSLRDSWHISPAHCMHMRYTLTPASHRVKQSLMCYLILFKLHNNISKFLIKIFLSKYRLVKGVSLATANAVLSSINRFVPKPPH